MSDTIYNAIRTPMKINYFLYYFSFILSTSYNLYYVNFHIEIIF